MRDALTRLAVADARRFEVGEAAALRELLSACTDNAMRAVLEEIISEDEEHLRNLDGLAGAGKPAVQQPSTQKEKPLPKVPETDLHGRSICERLQKFLKKERAAITFYELLAQRTPIPAVRRVFQHIAEAERAHAEKFAEQVRRICGDADPSEKEP